MATTTQSNVFLPELLAEAVKTEMGKADAFTSARMASYAVIKTDMPEGPGSIGKEVRIPHISMIGNYTDLNDGVDITPRSIASDYTTASVARAGLALDVTTWANDASPALTPEQAFAKQWVQKLNKKIDTTLMSAAVASSGMPTSQVIDSYSATTPVYANYDSFVDLKGTLNDREFERYGLLMHSKVATQLRKTKDSVGRNIDLWSLLPSLFDNRLDIVISDRCAISDGTFVVTESGTTPPDVTLTGTPNRRINFRMECTTLGARGTAVVRTSINGGLTWKTGITTAATFSLLDPDDDDASTGVTVNYENASAAVNNVWTATGTQKAATVLLAPKSLAFWMNGSLVAPEYERKVLGDRKIWASNLYYASARFTHDYENERRPDVALLYTNIPV
jgi:hypothetical protein